MAGTAQRRPLAGAADQSRARRSARDATNMISCLFHSHWSLGVYQFIRSPHFSEQSNASRQSTARGKMVTNEVGNSGSESSFIKKRVFFSFFNKHKAMVNEAQAWMTLFIYLCPVAKRALFLFIYFITGLRCDYTRFKPVRDHELRLFVLPFYFYVFLSSIQQRPLWPPCLIILWHYNFMAFALPIQRKHL